MDRTEVTCIDTDVTVGADVLEQSDKRMKVALDASELVLILHKETAATRLYVGHKFGMEFTSKGN